MTRRRRKRRRSPFYAPRRVPHAIEPAYMRARLAPLAPRIVIVGAATLAAESPLLPEALRGITREKAAKMGDALSADAQRMFFEQPGLDTLLVRGLSHAAGALAQLGRLWLRGRVMLGGDRDGRAATMLPLIPKRGFDSLMTLMLTAGTSVGAMRGGQVHSQMVYDSAAGSRWLPLPDDHPQARMARLDAPRTLTDLALDIDELYWAGGRGQMLKITRVGPAPTAGQRGRRWLVSLPGTDHVDFDTTPNPADTESNIREVLGLPSAMRVGTVMALHAAMAADGIAAEECAAEKVVICGHSQGGMVAVTLASLDPGQAGVDIAGVLSLGTPARRFPIRPEVTMVAVEHDQDVVPSMDGPPTRVPDHRVVVGRHLIRPRRNPLYYAHSSTTYAQTVRQLERKVDVAPFGRVPKAVTALRSLLPGEGEATRVTLHDVWQDIVSPTLEDTWDVFIHLDRSEREPVDYDAQAEMHTSHRRH